MLTRWVGIGTGANEPKGQIDQRAKHTQTHFGSRLGNSTRSRFHSSTCIASLVRSRLIPPLAQDLIAHSPTRPRFHSPTRSLKINNNTCQTLRVNNNAYYNAQDLDLVRCLLGFISYFPAQNLPVRAVV